ncbi:crotonobetaine/carnitine-CoA ligase [Thermomonospora echinospora]|uniref:Crotonobetaine/carnitine-CoA ligase n=1 Tax=Thermomonospora echinospora TaxID=1992 RepID=A0A1H5YN86_9ACTN|nr:AMP-binding protein [Thermomonospora echinospora]SEG25454.1 crotonobetaine/carnitine-CoA ligase [Thermomonospora echinospora]
MSDEWWGPAVPEAEDCVVGELLARRAAEHPDRVYAVFEDGTRWTYAETLAEAERVAAGLHGLGVRPGDMVVSWLPNGPDALRAWFGVNLLGGTLVPLNTAYRGGLLEHAIRLSGARVAVVHAELAGRLDDIDTGALERVVVLGEGGTRPGRRVAAPGQEAPGPQVLGPEVLATPAPGFRPEAPPRPWDPYAVILTSGTTGPSKGVLCSYVQLAACARAAFGGCFGEADRYMVNLPLFHAGGTIGTYAALLLGGGISLVSAFDTESFWPAVRATGTTHVTLLGVMATFLSKRPASHHDRAHPLRHVFMIPLIEDSVAFAERFGVDVVAMFNMTEVSIPIISGPDPGVPGTSGRLRPGVEARIVDRHDRVLPDGEVGELVLRTDQPWAMNSGYLGMPEATARAWRNGWFHTGDAFRTVDGEFFFVDRMGDTIRRRGENISSAEVEAELLAHPSVREAAVVAVPSPYGEDDVLAVVAPVEGATIDPAELLRFLIPRMAHFMVPRYVRVVDALPHTPTNKVEKHRLRSEGVTVDTADRERLGVVVRRDRIGETPAAR